MSNLPQARMHIAQAYTRASSPDAREHIRAALELLDGDPVGAELSECPNCGAVGLPETVATDHDCAAHRYRQNRRRRL